MAWRCYVFLMELITDKEYNVKACTALWNAIRKTIPDVGYLFDFLIDGLKIKELKFSASFIFNLSEGDNKWILYLLTRQPLRKSYYWRFPKKYTRHTIKSIAYFALYFS